MCRYWATTFPCGCFTWRSSGYEFCANRGNANCRIILERFVWKTFCPTSRKALKGKKYSSDTRLPACCKPLSSKQVEELCHKCNSLPNDSPDRPILWHCPNHLEQISKTIDVNAPAVFESAVQLWPIDKQKRYHRRKQDPTCKNCWWSE
ncbi:hypothetical protein F5Y19DRAFT_492620 [Xylariaceae sp. FL1651]|nr:hypothetical protein F5Y19DRAFT_492620 [Xylariaceae sp. FL1651]